MPGRRNPLSRQSLGRAPAAALVAGLALGCGDTATSPTDSTPACFDYASTPQFGGSLASIDAAREIIVEGTLAYVANPAIGVLVYDVSDPHAPELVGQYSTLGRIDALAKQGNLLLATDERNRYLLVLDATTPAGLALLGFVGFQSMPQGVVTRGQHAFVTTFEFANDASLHTVDFTNPSAPFIASTIRVEGTPFDLAIKDAVVYVVTAMEPYDFLLYDVTAPAQPRFAGVLQTPGAGVNFTVAAGRGYVADGARGVQIYDLANALAPRWIGSYDSFHTALQVHVDGSLAFVYHRPFVEVADVSDPSRPRTLGSEWLGLDAYAAHQGWMYFWQNAAFHAQDFSNPTFAGITARVGLTTPGYIELHANVAYVTAQNRIEILDVSRTEPAVVGGVAFGSTLLALAAGDSLACVGDANGVVHVLDITDPAAARLAGSVTLSDEALDLALHGSRIYALEQRFGLRVIDASSRPEPQLVGSLALGFPVLALAAAGDVVCVDTGAGVRIIDASVPSAPVQVGELAEVAIHAMEMRGQHLVLATQQGLVVYDLADPVFPVLGSRQQGWPNWTRAESIAFDATHAYVVSNPGVRVFDMTDASMPRYAGFFDLNEGTAYDGASDGRRLYLTTTFGLDVLPAACAGVSF